VFLKRLGAEFIAETSYALDVCERLDLPLAHEASQKRISGGSNGNGDLRSDSQYGGGAQMQARIQHNCVRTASPSGPRELPQTQFDAQIRSA
jgi:hypothetical protein